MYCLKNFIPDGNCVLAFYSLPVGSERNPCKLDVDLDSTRPVSHLETFREAEILTES